MHAVQFPNFALDLAVTVACHLFPTARSQQIHHDSTMTTTTMTTTPQRHTTLQGLLRDLEQHWTSCFEQFDLQQDDGTYVLWMEAGGETAAHNNTNMLIIITQIATSSTTFSSTMVTT